MSKKHICMCKSFLMQMVFVNKHGLLFIDALDILCAQLTRDLFAIAKFLYQFGFEQ